LEKTTDKEFRIGFKDESIKGCIDPDEIFKVVEDAIKRDNLEKCLKSGHKLFTH